VTLLHAEQLTTWFRTERGPVHAVTDVSLKLERGRTLGLVGESGSGKSVLIRSIMGTQLQDRLERFDGKVLFDGTDLRTLSAGELRQTWLKHISIVPQNPLTSLNPVLRIGNQIRTVLHYRFGMGKQEGNARAAELLGQVGIDDPERRLRAYPHELSGGMRQRIAIAMALAGEPDLLIADEPTTALDVTVQAQIVALLRRLREERNMAMIFVSHDIALVASLADEIAVMYGGRIVEQAPTDLLVNAPLMPYANALMRAIPQVSQPRRTVLAAIPGRPPTMLNGMPGCAFAPRCEFATAECVTQLPPLVADGADHVYACHHPVLQDAWRSS
jgi:peptide/nickel transport system ATP-binding protein